LQIQPANALAHHLLGAALGAKGQWDEAIAEWRRVLQIQPDHAEAWCMLGLAFQVQGRLAESLAAHRRGHELGAQKPNWSLPSAQRVREAEDLAERDALLPASLRGEAAASDAVRQVRFADFCRRIRGFMRPHRLYADALAAEPGLAEDASSWNCRNAASVAGHTGCGKETPPTAAAYKRCLDKFDAQETQIEKLQDEIKKMQGTESPQR
ncbi:MAG TPA: tetratricopeptide repeat protein, partial [Gemmataceae bacterium]|nr:tetratricopeptide repeat protein [Gemmataceae bacterium]